MLNSNCRIFTLMHYLRKRLKLGKRDAIDLCDETGTMKLLFLAKNPKEFALKYLPARRIYYVCRIKRGARGSTLQNAFLAVVPVLKNPPLALLEALRTQCGMLEKSRLKMIKMQEAAQKRALAEAARLAAKASKAKKGQKAQKGPYHKTRVDFLRKKGKPKIVKKRTK